MAERLHPAAIAVYAVDALRQGAVPLLVIFGVSVPGGDFDAEAALRAVTFAVAGTVVAALAGWFRWRTTTYAVADGTVRMRQGLVSVTEVEIPLARVQAVDIEQGPIQRLFGVYKADVQTGGGGAGGEIVLGALDAQRIARLQALVRPGGLAAPAAAEAPPVPERRLSRRRPAPAPPPPGPPRGPGPRAAG